MDYAWREVFAPLAPAQTDVVVLAFEQLDRPALDEIRAQARADKRIVAIVDAVDGRSARAALDAGADAVVAAKDAAELPAVVEAVGAGYVCLPRELRAAVAIPALSRREKQILGLVVLGLSNKEIAATLYVTESTVKSHLSSAFAKLGVSSRSAATTLILHPESGLGRGILAITDTS